MTISHGRRQFLKGTAAATVAAMGGSFLRPGTSRAATLNIPEVDRLTVRVLLDSSHDIFLGPQKIGNVEIQRARPATFPKILHNQWGLSLFLESQLADQARTLMLDFGYSQEALLNNIDILGVDPRKIDALIVSHGHYDHFGGLMGFLQKYRDVLPADLTLYTGGEHVFCHRYNRTPTQGQFADFGVLDRRELASRRVKLVSIEEPTTMAAHAFSTGPIKRTSFEQVLPNTMVEYKIENGLGCEASKFGAADKAGQIVPDEHIHEHATCFNVKGKGLVVITSCGHAGILNTIRQAQEVSGVRRLHALLGGFHLGPAKPEYAAQSVAELKAFEPDIVIPMHCSGLGFVQEVRKQMPDKLLISTTGSRVTFGA
jgi:7,8-dihydropterin-6-yl-methyl-4-(beta-D-ribofuranosyl)aminobenzene 5'-phosphate synthase